ncbi:Clavaminate synthase-like protein [Polychaeton citri CBS 116435]|uniref:Clavaminate synthase-like protein n=1 Tax=Polychaeton citri CBS 116435 TaxID=1314669 RepID=A0A9P4PZK6_9PEZI|nr:Clavaminate synthase-like protein [Polychaeton citri CBS 116435]
MPHAEDQLESEFTPTLYPPFPPDLPEVELETISLLKLLANDPAETVRVFEICKGRGFFYLSLEGTPSGQTILENSQKIAHIGSRTFDLPMSEKLNYTPKGQSLFGYKVAGATVTDKAGTKDTAEFFNVSKNDMILPESEMKTAWPSTILQERSVFTDYIRCAHETGMLILRVIAQGLGVDPEELMKRHRINELAGDHVRITRGPPREKEEMPEIQTPSHTDFGTITLLMNWLGGLQVWSNSSRSATLNDGQPTDTSGTWLWVKPKPGCAIINLGDAAVKFSNGVLCSGRHRVIPSPGTQGKWPRYSVVYFVRPEDACPMQVLKGSGIPEGGEAENEKGKPVLTAKEWIIKQAAGLGTKFSDEKR